MLLSGNEVNMTDSPTTRGLSTLSTDKFENDKVTLRKHEDTSILQRDSISNDIADLLEKASWELSDKKKDDSLHGRSCTTSQERPSDFERICGSILAIQNVLMVYPAYQSENVDEVVYVVIVNIETPELIQGINDLEIKYIIKESSLSNSRKYSTSNKNQKPEKSAEIINENTFDIQTAAVGDLGEIPNHTNKKQRRTQTFKSSEMLMSDEQHERLRSCMQKYANDLMTKHKYLSIIEGSIYQVDTSGPTYEPCLVLYVPAKGFIPIGEERFNASYDDIRVFVQEGIFRLFTGHADDIHKHTRMGCQISRAAFGTLGVFIEHPFYGLCGLTSAHVVLDDSTPFSVDMNGHCYFQSNEHKVYQPISPDEIGCLKEAVIKTGCVSQAGMEIALIQLEQRFPVNGDFPKPRVGATDISFTSGKTAGLNVSDVFCFKIGSATDYTEGTIIRNSNCVRDILRRADNFVIPLFIRFKIKPRSTLFAYEGDSGAPVFVKDVTGEPVCIGIIVGGNPDTGEVFVTHIEDILREFGNSKLKSFDDFVTLSRTLSEVTDAVKQLQNGHENLLNITESKLESLKNSTENKIDELKSYISQLFMERNGVGT
ncbi:uncharacterized protein LOC127881310 isoform X1 [Dreissena polymorpha]|uniref:uncharacterized protein LOC127881310 isoform X1 n=1 Tax=Dreissena polymorpha TaxID=45954 RepID=UPI002264EF4A|nr:uncharacterized protein LOC127881310 isoform X1 [Dreissena polymorpha]